MFGRYRRLVPRAHRDLIKAHGLPKPNWFVGSAEGIRINTDVQRAIDEVKAELDKRADSRKEGR